jgi:hypothetical protein
MAREAAQGHGYDARRLLSDVQDLHFGIAAELLHTLRLRGFEESLRGSFRELYGFMHDRLEEGRL